MEELDASEFYGRFICVYNVQCHMVILARWTHALGSFRSLLYVVMAMCAFIPKTNVN